MSESAAEPGLEPEKTLKIGMIVALEDTSAQEGQAQNELAAQPAITGEAASEQ